jgi:hypothetical protein
MATLKIDLLLYNHWFISAALGFEYGIGALLIGNQNYLGPKDSPSF